MAIALGVFCAVLAAALAVTVLLLLRTRSRLTAAEDDRARLESELDTALRPRPLSTTTERAVRRVVKTAARMRSDGVRGLLASTLEGLEQWAVEERTEVVSMAAADGTVTLFFSDIEDSTALNDRLGDEAWLRVLAAHDAVVTAQVGRYRGQVVKHAGDGFMVAFRDAEAACRAAAKTQRNLARTLDPRLWSTPIKVRIGIHTGQVVSRDGDYFGRNVAMTARVASVAGGGEVLASDAVREALDDDAVVALEDAGVYEFKGLTGTHQVWRVTW